jgi:hypothetical protein
MRSSSSPDRTELVAVRKLGTLSKAGRQSSIKCAIGWMAENGVRPGARCSPSPRFSTCISRLILGRIGWSVGKKKFHRSVTILRKIPEKFLHVRP